MVDEAELEQLVILRLEAMPDNVRISVGPEGELSKLDLINHVKRRDALGRQIVRMQHEYLKAMKTGF